MRNQINTMGGALQRLIGEMENLKTLAIGTMQLVKKLPSYEDAFEELKKENEQSESDTVGPNGSHEVR